MTSEHVRQKMFSGSVPFVNPRVGAQAAALRMVAQRERSWVEPGHSSRLSPLDSLQGCRGNDCIAAVTERATQWIIPRSAE
jgi:hypothetical protein